MEINDLTLAYLAGALDADGYFTIKRSTYHLRVRGDARVPLFSERIGLKQVDSAVPELLRASFGGGIGIQKPSSRNGKPLYGWQVTDKKAAAAAELLLPFLRIKYRQATILLELRRLKGLPRSGSIVVEQRDRWGRLRPFRKAVMSAEDVAARAALFERIKSLNDIRPRQPALG